MVAAVDAGKETSGRDPELGERRVIGTAAEIDHLGAQHAEAWARHPDCRVVALCDFNAERLDVVGSRYPEARRFERDADLLSADIEAVSIASYDSHHFEHVRTALERGLHVFVEKPLCRSEDEAAVLRALHTANPGLRPSSNLPLRRSPRFLELREQIRAGKLGRLYYAELDYEYGRLWKLTEGWRGREPEYSVMLGGGVHLIDLLLWLTGSSVTRVSASVGNRIVSEGTPFRYDQINAFEAHLAANGTRIVKLFLHISREEQRRRFQKRLDNPEKHWKWDSGDLETREKWDAFQAAYAEALERCSTEVAPWFVIPADHKWYRDLAAAEIIAAAARSMDPQWPQPEEDVSKVVIPE